VVFLAVFEGDACVLMCSLDVVVAWLAARQRGGVLWLYCYS
jgi:hypothetical protein